MAILTTKKLKSSSLVEILVASVLIVIILSVALMILSNVFVSNIKNDRQAVNNKINELEYYRYELEARTYDVGLGAVDVLEARINDIIIELEDLYPNNKAKKKPITK